MSGQNSQMQATPQKKTPARKAAVKMAIDVAMSVAFLVLMGRVYMPGLAHEATGTALLVLLIAHNVMNAGFWKGLARGKWSALRVYYLVIDLLLLLSMLATVVTGVLMSSELYQPLALKSGLMKVRSLHTMLFYVDLMLLGLHIGVHANVIAKTCIRRGAEKSRSLVAVVARILAVLLFIAGLVSAWQVDMLGFITLQNAFSYIDAGKPVLLFYAQHVSIVLLFAVLGHYLRALLASLK